MEEYNEECPWSFCIYSGYILVLLHYSGQQFSVGVRVRLDGAGVGAGGI